MKSFVVIFLSMAVSILSNPVHESREPKEIGQRRQFGSYSNNIIHENPNYPDQVGQSSVKVHLSQVEPRKPIYSRSPEYVQTYTQNYPTDAPQSQLFNVGYSVSFTNGENKKILKPPSPRYTRTKSLDDGEIITGTRKQNEEVQGPSINMSPQEFVSAALIGSKKQKISGIKPKPQVFINYQNPKLLLTQANLSPNTQKYYKKLEQSKPQIQNTQELQQKYTWRNLSPGVEIIRSTEVPIAQKYQTTQFDHEKAIGRSQDFDYTNALDNVNAPQNFALVRKPQPKQAPVIITQNVPKLSIDTSLLREPVPIQIDTRYIEEEMRNQLALYANQKYTPQNEDINYLQQNYRTIPVQEPAQNKPVQVVYQQQTQPQTFQEYQPESNRFQFKIYGKPQPLVGFDAQEGQPKRQPRFLSDLNTDLRPPPFDIPYQRRVIRVG